MKKTRIGGVPKFKHNLQSYLELSSILENSGVDGIFATDHIRTKDRFSESQPSCGVLLGGLRAKFPHLPLGPLVARTGSGLDEYVLSMLDTVGGPIVACLGIGDKIGKQEHQVSGLPWDVVEKRWEKLCETAQRCTERGWETYGGSDNPKLYNQLPGSVGVHLQHNLGDTITNRKLARAVFSNTNPNLIQYSIENKYEWVCIAQSRTETDTEYAARMRKAVQYAQAHTFL